MVDSEIMTIEKDTIMRALRDHPSFSEMFLAHILLRTIRVRRRSGRSTFQFERKTPRKSASYARQLWKRRAAGNDHWKGKPRNAGRNDRYYRSRVSFFMNKFRKLGFISYNGKIEVHTSLLSVVLSDHAPVQQRSAKIPGNGKSKKNS